MTPRAITFTRIEPAADAADPQEPPFIVAIAINALVSAVFIGLAAFLWLW